MFLDDEFGETPAQRETRRAQQINDRLSRIDSRLTDLMEAQRRLKDDVDIVRQVTEDVKLIVKFVATSLIIWVVYSLLT